MSNGQLNMVSVPTVTQMVTQEPTAQVAVAKDGMQQSGGGNFDEVLNGIQHIAKVKPSHDSGPTEKSRIKPGTDQSDVDAGTGQHIVDLSALFQVSQKGASASVTSALKPEDQKKGDLDAQVVPQGSDLPDITSLMVLAAYSQSARTPEVNIPTPLPASGLQNADTASEQSTVTSALVVKGQAEQTVSEPPQKTAAQPTAVQNQLRQPETVRTASVAGQPVTTVGAALSSAPAVPAVKTTPIAVQSETSFKAVESNILAVFPADRQQNAATTPEQPVVITAPAVKNQAELTDAEQAQKAAAQNLQRHAESALTTSVAGQPIVTVASAQTTPAAVQPEASFKTAEINIPAVLQVDRQQNVATASEQPAVIKAPAEPTPAATEKPAALPAAVQNQQRQPESALATAVEGPPVSTVAAAPAVTAVTAPAAIQATPTVVPVTTAEQSVQALETAALHMAASAPAADNHSARVVQETQGGRPHRNPEQLIEKNRTGNEPDSAKELTSTVQSAASDGESVLGSDTSRGDSNQRQTDSAFDNQMLAQQMRGQLSTEHQKVAALTTKAVTTESVNQDVPGQIMQQVKERLVQHDVKPGNQQITLTLSPDSLGELKMNLNLQGQKLSVEIVTENRTVRDAIVQHTDALKESLARQNITMSSFDVTTGGKGSGNQGQNQNAWRELAQQQQQKSWTLPRGYNIAQADLPPGQAAYQRQQGQTMLDIHY